MIKLLEWEYLVLFHYKYIERRSNHSVLGFLKLHSVTLKQVMIDCSMPELSAIKTVFPESSVSICKWYILRNVRTEARSIFNDKESQDYAVAKITALLIIQRKMK